MIKIEVTDVQEMDGAFQVILYIEGIEYKEAIRKIYAALEVENAQTNG